MGYIIDIGTALPGYQYDQAAFASFYASLAHTDEEKRKIALIGKRSGISRRYSAFAELDKLFEMSLTEKMALYHREAFSLALSAIRQNAAYEGHARHITHLITVSCTGMQAPGIEIDLIEALGLRPGIARLNINLMGCYAAITALKAANDICRSQPDATVLIVCVELCTLHFQKRFDDNYVLSNLLFADGAASLLVSAQKPAARSFSIEGFYSQLFARAKDDMCWNISEDGFLMKLTTAIPAIIQDELKTDKALEELAHRPHSRYAIHPGGKQIIESVKSALQIGDDAVSPALNVLQQYGNMSSPTVLFVLRQLQERLLSERQTGIPVFGCSFGPGLAFESFNLAYVQ